MKPLTHSVNLTALLMLVFKAQLTAQPTTFTYQGRLLESGTPADGTYDMRFTLYDAVNNGNVVAGPRTNSSTVVVDGLFTVQLDFGAAAFDGQERWLEIAARRTGGGVFNTLDPRQEITATPYSVRSLEAASVPANAITTGMIADGAVTGAKVASGAVSQLGTSGSSGQIALQVSDDGLVGIGTTDPDAGLDITSARNIFTLEPLFQVGDGTGSYRNLYGAAKVSVNGDLLAVSAPNDSAFTLLNITNRSSPVVLSEIKDGDGAFTDLAGARGIALAGSLLVVAGTVDDAVTLIDVTDPANPSLHAALRDGVGGFNELAGAFEVAMNGNLLAVAAYGDDAVTLVDISNPADPQLRAVLKDGMFGFNELDSPEQLAFHGTLLAIAASDDNAVTLVDAGDPTSPILRSVMKDGVGGFQSLRGATALAMSGDLLAIGSDSGNAVTLVDISDPSNPALISVIRDGENGFNHAGSPLGLAFSGNRLALAAFGDDAVNLVDLADPRHPRPLGVAIDGIGESEFLDGPLGIAFAGNDMVVAGFESSGLSILQPVARGASLSSRGWVGIGTAVPVAPLHVEGDAVISDAEFVTVQTLHFSAGSSAAASGLHSSALGADTVASGLAATALGSGTSASGDMSMAFGYRTSASGDRSIALGSDAIAAGDFSLAAGRAALARHRGTFVWADALGTDFASSGANQFLIRAGGGVGINENAPAAPLHVTGGTDASPSGGGYIVSGRVDSSNIALDDNEIMARRDGAAATLFLNNDGGTVRAGEDLEVLGNVRAYQRLFVKGRLSVQDMPFGDYRNVQWDDVSLQFYQDNSSRRHKENIRPLKDDFQQILAAQPKTYTRPGRPDRWEIGLIAEEIDALGLKRLVDYDRQGRPDGVKYDKLPLYLIKVAAAQDQAIKALQARNAELENRLEKLERMASQNQNSGQNEERPVEKLDGLVRQKLRGEAR